MISLQSFLYMIPNLLSLGFYDLYKNEGYNLRCFYLDNQQRLKFTQ